MKPELNPHKRGPAQPAVPEQATRLPAPETTCPAVALRDSIFGDCPSP